MKNYWLTPTGELIPVRSTHCDTARSIFNLTVSELLLAGYYRIANPYDNQVAIELATHATNEQLSTIAHLEQEVVCAVVWESFPSHKHGVGISSLINAI